MRVFVFILISFLLFTTTLSAQKTKEFYSEKKAKYVFYFIGDGMGLAHVSLTEMYLAAKNDEVGMKSLNMTSLPVAGLAKTYCKNSYITCSAAAGTALATGEKTNFGRLGVFPDSILRNSIAIDLSKKNFKIGIISTVSIDHATPASFYAHRESRSDYYEIGKQMLETNIDFFAGGGFNRPKGKEKDKEDLHKIAEKKGFKIIRDIAELKPLKQNEKLIFINPIIKDEAEIPLAIDRHMFGGYKLADFIGTGIEALYNENGFFIMAEGGLIDWVAHTNDAASIVREVLDFDEAIGVALDFYKKHPDETLIVITADHETGGLSLGSNWGGYTLKPKELDLQKVSAWHVGSKLKQKMKENASFDNILELLNSEFFANGMELKDHEIAKLKAAYDYLTKAITITEIEKNLLYGGEYPLAVAATQIVNNRAGVGFTSFGHTGIPVPVYAIGVGSKLFQGYIENTDIPKYIKKAMGID